MHSDASDVGFGGTLGTDITVGSPGLREARGLWSIKERKQPMTYREIRAVRLPLARSFDEFVSDPHIGSLFLHEDSQAVVSIINAMVLARKPTMSELRKLNTLLHELGVII